jgi:hypothetical protein
MSDEIRRHLNPDCVRALSHQGPGRPNSLPRIAEENLQEYRAREKGRDKADVVTEVRAHGSWATLILDPSKIYLLSRLAIKIGVVEGHVLPAADVGLSAACRDPLER